MTAMPTMLRLGNDARPGLARGGNKDMINAMKSCFRHVAAVGGAFLLMAGLTQAHAQFSTDGDAPIDITGAQFEVFQTEDYSVWTGDVQVVQGEVILTAPKLTIHGISSGGFNKVVAEGGIRYTNGVEAISGRQAVYQEETDSIVVTGDVVVVQGKQVMTGQKMTYYLDSGKIIFNSDRVDRVRGVFFTDDDEDGPSS